MSGTWADRQVYWATLAYVRWWLAVDGPLLGALKTERGFTAPLLRRVAVRYNVNRGLLQPKGQCRGQDRAADGVIALLRDAEKTWPADLAGRAAKCVEVAEKALDENHTDKLQVSGVSKFMWFLKPEEWTLFDRFTAAGMGIPAHWDRRSQFEAFYAALAEADFVGAVRRIQAVIASSSLPKLPASRVLDALLMARGQRGAARHEIEESGTFLSLLPQALCDDLDQMADQLQRAVGNDILTHKPANRKKH